MDCRSNPANFARSSAAPFETATTASVRTPVYGLSSKEKEVTGAASGARCEREGAFRCPTKLRTPQFRPSADLPLTRSMIWFAQIAGAAGGFGERDTSQVLCYRFRLLRYGRRAPRAGVAARFGERANRPFADLPDQLGMRGEPHNAAVGAKRQRRQDAAFPEQAGTRRFDAQHVITAGQKEALPVVCGTQLMR